MANHRKHNSRAATMVEFAMIAPVLFIFILGFIDICRYWSTRVIMQYAANSAARLASELRNIDYNNLLEAPAEDHDEFLTGRTQVLTEGVSLPLAMWVAGHDTPEAGVHTVAFTPQDGAGCKNVLNQSEAQTDVVLLRPCECYVRVDSQDARVLRHPSKPSCDASDTNMSSLLVSHPLIVYSELKFRWLFPFVRESTISTSAIAYRERLWNAPLQETYEPPPPPPTVTMTPLVPPTFTGTAGPANTDTPTPGPSNTPTITRTPTNTRTPTPTGTITNTPTVTPTALDCGTEEDMAICENPPDLPTCLNCAASRCNLCKNGGFEICMPLCMGLISPEQDPALICEGCRKDLGDCDYTCPTPLPTVTRTATRTAAMTSTRTSTATATATATATSVPEPPPNGGGNEEEYPLYG